MLHIFSESIGTSTNNARKLSTLLTDLTIARHQGWNSLIMEGDSMIIIHTTQHLLCGSNIQKLSKNWRLNRLMEHLLDLLLAFSIIQTSHVRRKANKFLDYLENHGVNNPNNPVDSSWVSYTNQPSRVELQTLAM